MTSAPVIEYSTEMYRVHRLDHVNLRTEQPGALAAFYSDVVGLRNGARPDFNFPGAWLYCGERASVHIVGVSSGQVNAQGNPGPLSLEHFAFRASGLASFLANLEKFEVPHRDIPVPDFEIFQVNINDPDGNHIHVDFDIAEAQALGLV